MELLNNPVIVGILASLSGAFIAFLLFQIEKIKYRKEIKELKKHLNNQMEITAEGTKTIREELEKMKKQNENLRISLRTLQQKPDRKEIRLLYIYDKALSKLIENAPGFGPMWVKSVKEAEEDYTEVESGFIAFTKKMLGISSSEKLNMYKMNSEEATIDEDEEIRE